MNTAKQEVQTMLRNLPENCTLEDIQYHVYVLSKIKKGLQAIERGETVTHEEAMNYFRKKIQKWTTK